MRPSPTVGRHEQQSSDDPGQTGDKYSKALQFWLQYLNGEDARYPDGAAYSFQAQRGHVGVVAVLQAHTESSQERRPCQLKNGGGEITL